jgi:hypothetical protein
LLACRSVPAERHSLRDRRGVPDPIYPTIAEALCLSGKRLAVDAVLPIGEHGRYPIDVKGKREYPRKRFFDAIVAVFEASCSATTSSSSSRTRST